MYFEKLIDSKGFQEKLDRFIVWRNRHIKERQFIYLLAILIGFLSGMVAVVIKYLVLLVELILVKGFPEELEKFLYVGYPLLGLVLTVWIIKRFIHFPVNPGIPNTLYAISKRKGLIKFHNIYSSIITSAVTVGFGGSGGLEGPTVGTTSAISSNLSRAFRLNYKTKILLIGCAASGAMAALFKAPVAAIVFAIEVIMLDLTTASLIPLLMASASAAITSRIFHGDDFLIHFPVRAPFEISDLPFYVLLGILAGGISIYFTRIYFWVASYFDRNVKPFRKAIIGGLALGVILFLFPALYGEGYEAINALTLGKPHQVLENSLLSEYSDSVLILLLFLFLATLMKAIATSITIKAGGICGIFAPALFMGSFTGYFFSRSVNHFSLGEVSESNFTLVGMGGMMAGILHAPLTAIFLIAEITGGYELFLPLMITASIAYITVKIALPHGVYTFQLARRGELITHDKDQAVLTLMELKKEIETDFLGIAPYATLGELVEVVSRSSRNIFPVLDESGNFLGMIQLNDIRDIMFNRDLYDKVEVHELMSDSPEHIAIGESMESVMSKFESTGAWNLPVLERSRYVGFVSKSKLFSAYRNLLKDFYETNE